MAAEKRQGNRPASRVLAFEKFSSLSRGSKGSAPKQRTNRKGLRMPLYEHVFLARQEMTAQQVEELANQYKGVVEQNGGKIVGEIEYWGVKSLTFRIKKNRKAHFSMLRLDTPPAAIQEVERLQGISEDVIRFMTVRVEAHDEGPSVMLQKRDRDERRGDRRRDRDGEDFDGPAAATEEAAQ
jgi:small subunit ribosomal protein S6